MKNVVMKVRPMAFCRCFAWNWEGAGEGAGVDLIFCGRFFGGHETNPENNGAQLQTRND